MNFCNLNTPMELGPRSRNNIASTLCKLSLPDPWRIIIILAPFTYDYFHSFLNIHQIESYRTYTLGSVWFHSHMFTSLLCILHITKKFKRCRVLNYWGGTWEMLIGTFQFCTKKWNPHGRQAPSGVTHWRILPFCLRGGGGEHLLPVSVLPISCKLYYKEAKAFWQFSYPIIQLC